MNCNSETEEETIAVQKKRSRRVSFAENTSIHIFDRDDEYETPPEAKPSSPAVNETELGRFRDSLGFGLNSAEANVSKEFLQNEDEEDEEDDDMDARGPFLRPMESPSSGSGFGSATYNDEDHFFGPVSSSFIRPGRLSDSAPSDDNHEVTMDSTAFSMNFRSLAKSDSGGDLLTSTGVHLSFEEKTPTQDTVPTNQGNSMVLTVAKRPISLSSMPIAKLRTGDDSNDMSLVGETSHRYDYGRLSPGLNALLAQTSKDSHATDNMDIGGDADKETVGNDTHDGPTETVSIVHDKLGLANDSNSSLVTQSNGDFSFIASSTPASEVPSPVQSARLLQVGSREDSIRDDLERRPSFDFYSVGGGTISNLDNQGHKVGGFTLQEWKSPGILTPTHKQASFFIRNENTIHSTSASIQKSISKLKMLEASPFSSSLSAKIDSSNIRSLHFLPRTPLDTVLEKNRKSIHVKHAGTPHKLASSVEKILEMKSPSSPDYAGQDLGQHVQFNESINFGSGQDAGPRGNVVNTDINHLKGLTEDGNMEDGEINLLGRGVNLGTIRNLPTPLRARDSHSFQSTTPDRNSRNDGEQASFRNNLAAGRGRAASPIAHKGTDDLSIRKNLVEWFAQSPLRKEQQHNIHSLAMEGALSPKSSQLTYRVENSPTRKRSNDEIIPHDEIARIQRSPKLSRLGLHDPDVSETINENDSGASTSDHELMQWPDIYSNISGDVKNLLSPSADKLNLQAIDVLEDILVRLLRKQTYEILSTEMHSQKTVDPSSNLQRKRVLETKLLLHKLVNEQAKLQLMLVKRERLLKKVQVLRSGIQESQILRSNHLLQGPQRSLHIQAEDSHPRLEEDIQHQEAHEKVTLLGKALEDSKTRITNLTKSFHMYCKLKGEPGCADTVVLVNNHLTRRKCCRFLRLDLQLWDVDNLESRNRQHNVVINYLGFITQRLKLTSTPVSSISISNELNNINIIKNLPEMEACTAFAFVFNAEATRKYVGPRSLAEETQIISSLLGNLLDVVEEVQSAQLELRNLVQSTFHSESAEQLDLQLCFIDFKSSRKAMLTFDLSCLKSGVYPSEILPSQMAAPADENFSSQQLIAEVIGGVQSLKAGYLRIIRACRCISQIVEASSR